MTDTALSVALSAALSSASPGAIQKQVTQADQGSSGAAPSGDKPPARNQRPARPAAKASHAAKAVNSHPILAQLAALYPQLFGARFVPLKRGIFQDLVAAHPGVLDANALKPALGFHTRSTRYLQGVAAGVPRHDLAGQPVEAMAPDHVYQALVEVFRRRQGRAEGDLTLELRERIVIAFEASGLSPDDYMALVRTKDEAANATLALALTDASERQAKDEALLRAMEAGGQTADAFADMYGMPLAQVQASVQRAQAARAARDARTAREAAASADPTAAA